MNKRTKALQFSTKTKQIIIERDQGCIFCRLEMPAPYDNNIFDIAHVVNKSQGGLGIKENGVVACRWHHNKLDNSSQNKELREMAVNYLKAKYSSWNAADVTYKKYG